ncbi:S8 family serine peptidase [Hydrogenophaga sp.]|uniref:S8 family peptidase n=1 Tax=Hydrogenophaga sp. TaxID=1904254 RepID=UPI00356803D9
MLQTGMRRFFISNRLRGGLLLAGLIALSPCVLAQGGPGALATGLIIGFKPQPDTRVAPQETGPWASPGERAKAQWARASRDGRERVARLARDAGLPMQSAGEAGSAQLLRFEHPLRGVALENALRRARLDPDVAWVEPNVRVPLAQAVPVVPNDPGFTRQWHLQTPDLSNPAGMGMPQAWARSTGSAGQVVAVVDTGVRMDHPDLAGRLLPGYDMVSDVDMANDGGGRDADPSDPGDWVTAAESNNAQGPFYQCTWDGTSPAPYPKNDSSWHGTFISGQIAAASNNGAGVSGLNWAAQILPVRVAGKCGAMVNDLLDGVRWAAGLPVSGAPTNTRPARIINLSFGGDAPCSKAYQDTFDAVHQAGALVVVAAGNGSGPLARPADCQRVMAVAAVRKDGAKAEYSSFGAQVALSVPGGSTDSYPNNLLLSTYNSGATTPGSNTYGLKQGTSFAAPLAAGVASLMLAVNPALSPDQLAARMKAGVRPHESLGGYGSCGATHTQACNCTTSTCGAGLLDADRALQLATGPAAVIAAIGTVAPAAQITLDGSKSAGIPGSSIVAYRWQQLEGPTVVLPAPQAAQTQVTLAGELASYKFRLTVTDDQGRTGEDTVAVGTAWPTNGGGGAWGWMWGVGLWLWLLGLAVSVYRPGWVQNTPRR